MGIRFHSMLTRNPFHTRAAQKIHFESLEGRIQLLPLFLWAVSLYDKPHQLLVGRVGRFYRAPQWCELAPCCRVTVKALFTVQQALRLAVSSIGLAGH